MEIACSSCLGSQLLLVWFEYECVVVCFSASALCQAGDLSRLYPDSRSVASGLRYICCNGCFVHHRNQSDSPWYLYLQEAGIRRRKVSPHRQHLPLCDCMCLSSWSKVSFSCRSKPTQSYILSSMQCTLEVPQTSFYMTWYQNWHATPMTQATSHNGVLGSSTLPRRKEDGCKMTHLGQRTSELTWH